ncbi:unnamed protein product [Acanthosepion pharaonis]|uniref:Uncharacterized protein n=1 Tax=Acanthosepion pharaonis TaxID=158019 RepID=A0A812DGV4_ACAPH|nr:unnamed protein product [Sepia pharaonis]
MPPRGGGPWPSTVRRHLRRTLHQGHGGVMFSRPPAHEIPGHSRRVRRFKVANGRPALPAVHELQKRAVSAGRKVATTAPHVMPAKPRLPWCRTIEQTYSRRNCTRRGRKLCSPPPMASIRNISNVRCASRNKPADQHQRAWTVGHTEPQDLALGPPPVCVAIGDPDAKLLPQAVRSRSRSRSTATRERSGCVPKGDAFARRSDRYSRLLNL